MADSKMMRNAGRYWDGDRWVARGMRVGEEGEQHVILADSRVERDVIPITFNNNDEITINDENMYRSDNIDISKYKNIDIFITSNVNSSDLAVDVYGQIGRNLDVNNLIFFDWNEESWESSFLSNSVAQGKYVEVSGRRGTYLLTTHPNFYWLKDTNLNMIRLRVKALSEPESSPDNVFSAWLVGEKYV